MLVPALASAQDSKRVLLYTGTTGFRHTDGINGGRPVVQSAIEAAGYTVDWEDCTNNGGGATNCDNANKNPRIFTDENLARYDAIVLLNSSAGPPGPLWSDAQKASIIKYVQNGGGIAGVHNATDMGTTAETWNWWDGNNGNSVVGATMAGHAATSTHEHRPDPGRRSQPPRPRRDLPDTYGFGDEHYNFRRNVRGSHHVLATIDERTYTPGGNAMGQDHPITWCKLYDGDNVNDNTGTPKAYNDGRTWVTSMGHFGSQYTENGGNNNLDQADRRRRPLGRRRGPQVRLLGHRVVVLHARGPRRRREQPDRDRRREGRQGLLVRDRQPDRARVRPATSRCTTRPSRPATRPRSRRS